jgi:hypothetical protein
MIWDAMASTSLACSAVNTSNFAGVLVLAAW